MKHLTPFQFDFLKTVKWFTDKKGEYSFSKKYIYDQYSNSLSPEQIDNDIIKLIEDKFLVKAIKKISLENRFVTKVTLAINYDKLKEYVDWLKVKNEAQDLLTDKISDSLVSFNAQIKACEEDEDYESALNLLVKLDESIYQYAKMLSEQNENISFNQAKNKLTEQNRFIRKELEAKKTA
ncbi:MAG: hypothetical protein EOO46_09325 [Flavobacterium sp.]|nr:MAG: hypothetical protein EOO46_09325 [Flavobacterium sp.]